MTERQIQLIHDLRLQLLRTGYPAVFVVSQKVLEAAEVYLTEWLERNKQPPILQCGKYGLLFKGCELVLEVKDESRTD